MEEQKIQNTKEEEIQNNNQNQKEEETSQQKFDFCKEILAEIMKNLTKSLDDHDQANKIQQINHNVNKKINKKELTLNDFVKINNQEILHTMIFTKNNSENEKYVLNHLKVHQQVIWNLCGYHSTFSQIQILNMLKSQQLDYPYLINNSTAFWKHHFSTTRFLRDYAKNKNKLTKDQWPWNERTIQFGDFERSFAKVSFESNPDFINAMKNENNFEIESIVFQFQFGRVINESEEDVHKMQKSFSEFSKFSKPNVHKIITFQLGITNHWAFLIAHKINSKVEFWFLDSKNLNFLEWDETRIEQYIKEWNEEKIKKNKDQLTPYKKMIIRQCLLDFQQALNLLVNCLLGNQILQVYIVEKQILILWKMFLQDNQLVDQHYKLNNANNFTSFFELVNTETINLVIQEQIETWAFCYQKQYNHIFDDVQKYSDSINNNAKILFEQQEKFFEMLYEYLQQEEIKKLNLQIPSINKIFKKRQALFLQKKSKI